MVDATNPRTDRVLFSYPNESQFSIVQYDSTPTQGSDHRYAPLIRPVFLVADVEIKDISHDVVTSYIDNVHNSNIL